MGGWRAKIRDGEGDIFDGIEQVVGGWGQLGSTAGTCFSSSSPQIYFFKK